MRDLLDRLPWRRWRRARETAARQTEEAVLRSERVGERLACDLDRLDRLLREFYDVDDTDGGGSGGRE